ncbi:hypothetical protein Geu3261_0030_012 [Komagataeibacter europaeus NBRC 3261]|uniref:Uncharacterized protein n=1 Tax=Komagataeibacter europaeus NBRC 3261 TaxID=1234669 RepID=A0A0D6PXU8_KOMEU|nr:hypothetical protein Geu3261_0030_012 [Komagataeibacter europaeus NBRC 3261]
MASNEGIEKRIDEARKLGHVSSSEWQSYTWKNELSEQRRRIITHLGEALAEEETDYNPYHMLGPVRS